MVSEQRRDAAGVVVGTVVDVADRAVGVTHAAVADVVVVGADDDEFVFQDRVGAGLASRGCCGRRGRRLGK